jgi:anti-sigma factor RsiW
MCDFSGRLIAWIDGEVGPDEAAGVEQHIAVCGECRNCVREFGQVSGAFEEYCEQVARFEERHQATRVTPVLWAAAIVLAVILAYPRPHGAPAVLQPNVTAAAQTSPSPAALTARIAAAPESRSTLPRAIRRRPRTDTQRNQGAACCAPAKEEVQPRDWVVDEPSVHIAIAAAAMFPPGAVPEGVSFVADLSIGADGSARQVRLQPQISEFERRAQP